MLAHLAVHRPSGDEPAVEAAAVDDGHVGHVPSEVPRHFPGAEIEELYRSPCASAHQKLLRGIKAQALDGRAVPREAPYAACSTDSPNVHPLHVPEWVSQTTCRAGGEGGKAGGEPRCYAGRRYFRLKLHIPLHSCRRC